MADINTLLVPVTAGRDGKTLSELAREVAAIAEKARGKTAGSKRLYLLSGRLSTDAGIWLAKPALSAQQPR
jgi:hypothetical protein